MHPNLKQYLGDTPLFYDLVQPIKVDSLLSIELSYVQLLPYEFGDVNFYYPNDYNLIQNSFVDVQSLRFSLISPRTINSLQLLSSQSITSFANDGNQATLKCHSYDSNGDWLASSGAEGGIKIWETANWSVLQTLDEHIGTVTGLSTSTNGQWSASGGSDQNIIIWDTDSWNSVQTLSEHLNDVVLLSFAMNNSWLASVEKGDHRILIWSTEDCKKNRHFK